MVDGIDFLKYEKDHVGKRTVMTFTMSEDET